jgi:D-xylonolactonase
MQSYRVIQRPIRDQLGEGLLWSARENAVYWVDILAPALHRLSLADDSVCS